MTIRQLTARLVAASAITAVVAVVGVSCTSDRPAAGPLLPPTGTGEVALAALQPSDSCDAVAERVRTVLLDAVDDAEAFAEAMNDGIVAFGSEDSVVSSPPTMAQSASGDAAGGGGEMVTVTGLSSGDASGVVIAGSNDQEVGVAEGNSTVTDGTHLFTTVPTPTGRELRIVSLEGSPRVVGSVALRGASNGTTATDAPGGLAGLTMAYSEPPALLLRGDELVVVSSNAAEFVEMPFTGETTPEPAPESVPGTAPGSVPGTAPGSEPGTAPGSEPGTAPESEPGTEPGAAPGAPAPPSVSPPKPWTSQPTTSVTLIDVTDPAAPRVESTTTLEGWAVATRMVDDVPRVVLSSTPDVVAQVGNEVWGDPAGARAQIETIGGEQVVPRRVMTDGTVQPLVGCDQVLATPDVTAGVEDTYSTVTHPELVSVVSIGATLDELSTTTVQGGTGLGTTVYASPAAVYLTSGVGTWDAPTSAIHRIELTDAGSRYTGSGTVPGFVLDQYSLSERNGDLRVVTTTSDPAVPTPLPEPLPGSETTVGPAIDIAPVPATEGRLTVLRPGPDGVLTEIGHVDDLGVGERVQSVRFTDDIAYVVTFRQVDPLFAIDVSDPTAPRVLGELKIPGFSEYLHPLGDGKLLGVGVDADDQGVTTGAKVSLFDVSDPASPVETAVLSFPDSTSRLRGNPLAFTWDPLRRTASFPLDRYAIGRVNCTTSPVQPAAPAGDDSSIMFSPQTCAPSPDPGGPDGSRRVFVRVVDDRLELAREFAPDANGDRMTDESMMRAVVVDDRIHGVTDSAVWTFDAELRNPEVRTPL